MTKNSQLTRKMIKKDQKSNKRKGHVEVVKNISNVVANNSPPDKIRKKASFSFYQKIDQNMGWSNFGAILI